METKLSTKGQLVLAGKIRRKLGLQAGDSLDAKVLAGSVVLTPRKKPFSKPRIRTDPKTGLPVLSVGARAPRLTSKQVHEILADFP